MKLWTFQNPTVRKTLEEGLYYCRNFTPCEIKTEADKWLSDCYRWGQKQGEKITGNSWPSLPVFCWTKKPDVRRFTSGVAREKLREYDLLALDVPESDYILCSYHMWSIGPFGGGWIQNNESDEGVEEFLGQDRIPFSNVPERYIKNWETCFEKSVYSSEFAQNNYASEKDFDYLQALVNGIRPEWFISYTTHRIAW